MNILPSIKLLVITSLLAFVTGCAHTTTQQVASIAGFKQEYIQTKTFKLMSYQKIQQAAAPINIYIEGDGRAWVNRFKLASDPSPRSPLVMQLAALDTHPNVIYLARPCQYSPEDLNTVCEDKYWSIARYAQVVVDSVDQAITKIKYTSKAEKINLIGYSGGAAIAVLIAARRDDIASIRTIAGNLDLLAMQEYHDTTPLSESLDPLQVAKQIQHIPQLHFVGKKDHVVPTIVAENFRQAAGLKAQQVMVLSKAGHNAGWVTAWPELLTHSYVKGD